MDLSDASEPVQLLVETDASLTPEEQDANINIINGIWDMNLATFALNAVTISDLQNVFSTVAGGGSNLIAGTETGATASQAYVKGQYIIWGGRLWEVTAAIAQGDQFVIGSNLSATSTTVGNELTELNSSLDDIDIRYNATSGKPEWRERGAGSFVPFSSGVVKSMVICSSPIACYINEDGTCGYTESATAGGNSSPFVTFLRNSDMCPDLYYVNTGGSGTSYYNCTIQKSGYYILHSEGVYTLQYISAGQTKQFATTNRFANVYFGETNPFE